MKHKHHIIPKHMGGSNDPENLIELSIEEHARLIDYSLRNMEKEDYWAWMGLSGQIGKEEILKEMNYHNGRKVYEDKIGIFADVR
jgi:hypothetical protein